MPSWTDYVGFGLGLLGLLGVLHLIAFIRPQGWVSRRLHPSFAANPETNYALRQTVALEALVERVKSLEVKLEQAGQRQPDSLGNLELVTTVRRQPSSNQS
jgi:hypothetical protein